MKTFYTKSTEKSRIVTVLYEEICQRILVYILSEDETDGRSSFGISVSLLSQKGEMLDSCFIHDVTSNRDEAVRIVGILRKGKVTPCCAAEIAEDIIA